METEPECNECGRPLSRSNTKTGLCIICNGRVQGKKSTLEVMRRKAIRTKTRRIPR